MVNEEAPSIGTLPEITAVNRQGPELRPGEQRRAKSRPLRLPQFGWLTSQIVRKRPQHHFCGQPRVSPNGGKNRRSAVVAMHPLRKTERRRLLPTASVSAVGSKSNRRLGYGSHHSLRGIAPDTIRPDAERE
jgi:hypothetical protein